MKDGLFTKKLTNNLSMKYEYFIIVIFFIAAFFLVLHASKDVTNTSKEAKIQSSKRYELKDVKPGQKIQIEWRRIEGKLGYLECINNDPFSQKILLQVRWENYKEIKCHEFQNLIFSYNDEVFDNFHLLNSKPKEPTIDFHLSFIEQKMNDALKNENYELAEKIKQKINKILTKQSVE